MTSRRLQLGLTVLVLWGTATANTVLGNDDSTWLHSVVISDATRSQKQKEIAERFRDRTAALIEHLSVLDYEESEVAEEMGALCRVALTSIASAQDYALLTRKLQQPLSLRAREHLCSVIGQQPAFDPEVRRAPKVLLDILHEDQTSWVAAAAAAKALSRAGVQEALPGIVARRDQRALIPAPLVASLDASLIRLRHKPTLQSYAAQLASPDFQKQSYALSVFARSAAPVGLQYVMPWIRVEDTPDVEPSVNPPYRYCDAAAHFAEYFRRGEGGPLRITAVPRYDVKERTDLLQWWESVKHSPRFR